MQPHGGSRKKLLTYDKHHRLQLPTPKHFFFFCLHILANGPSSLVGISNSSQCDPNDDPKEILWLLRMFYDEELLITSVIVFLDL
jgi:hypothetical protein